MYAHIRRYQRHTIRICILLAVILMVSAESTEGAVFTTNALISEIETNYEGQDIFVSGATLTLDGAHSFNSLMLTNGAVLTHSPCTMTNTHKLDLTVTNAITVSTDSRIDVSGKGYLPGRTRGNTTVGAASGYGGGSYGGLGFGASGPQVYGSANSVYGDYATPDEWGSGGGGASGGGLLWLTAQRLQLDGQLLANGTAHDQGGGSGGGLYVAVQTLDGSGVIRANGGAGIVPFVIPGGGGRVAVYASDWSGFVLTNITATSGGDNAGAGTVYLRDMNQITGTLVIDNRPFSLGWTPLGLPGTNVLTIRDAVVIRGGQTQVRAEHSGLAIEFANTLTVTNGGRLELENLLLSGGTPLSLNSNSLVQLSGTLTSTAPVIIDGGRLSVERFVAPGLRLTNAAELTSLPSTTNQMHKLEVEVGTITISTDSRIDVSGKGYLAGRTRGNTTVGAASGYGGGSYGGLGFGANGPQVYGSANSVYGDYATPDEWGSGGGGASGGGLLWITAQRLQLDGQLLANGTAHDHGGGSGGGLYVAVQTLDGSGVIRANGGAGFVPYVIPGGGGRVAVYATDWSGFVLTNITAISGGDGAGAGTVWIVNGTSHTHVRYTLPGELSLYPTNNYTRWVPTPLSNGLVVYFSRPIDTNSFLHNFSLQGPLSPILSSGISEIGERLYRIAFPAQTENGAYQLTLFRTMLDADGFQLDQNANGIPGEPEDAFSVTLILDTVPPRITQYIPSGDVTGTITDVDLWFSETMDINTLSTAGVSMRNPSNGFVSASKVSSVGLNRFRISFPAQTSVGQYHVFIGTNFADLAGNPLQPSVLDPAIAYDASFNLVPVDLELSNVATSTNQLWAGDTLNVSWTGRNLSGAPLLGGWTDGVFLSHDPYWDINDVPLGTVLHTNGLAANETYTNSLSTLVPGLLPGNYYVVIRADIFNQEREIGETNNIIAFGPLTLRIRELTIGGDPFSGVLTPQNRAQYFAIHVGAGQSLRFQLGGQAGVNQLFVNFSSLPTQLNYDFGGTLGSSSQTVPITGAPGGGTYYVLVYGNQIVGANPFTLSVETAPFFASAVNPSSVVVSENEPFWSALIRSNSAATTLSGVGFDQSTSVEFIDSLGATRTPARVEFISPAGLNLFLNLSGWPADVYSVRVRKGPDARVLTNAFTVVGSGQGKFEARIAATSLSPGGGQTVYVDYANTGTRAIPAPLLKVIVYTNATIISHRLNNLRFTGDGGVSRVNNGSGGRAHDSIPSYVFRVGVPLNSVQALAVGSSANPGLLLPGETGRFSVYFAGLRADHGESQLQFSVGSVTADDTTIVEFPPPAPGVPGNVLFPRTGQRSLISFPHGLSIWTNGTERLFSIDWPTLQRSSQPETVGPDAWTAVWQNLVANTGPLWSDYVLMLDDNLNYLKKLNQTTNDPSALFNFELLQASGALHPVRTLARSVDASAPSPGFPLVFRRVYNQPILSRYKTGALGRGWTHNWEISIQPLAQVRGVVVHGPNGADRIFYNASGTTNALGYGIPEQTYTYYSPLGENGTLTFNTGIFSLREPDGTLWRFDSNDRLDYVEDPNGNRITCGYSGVRLTSITHSSGKQLILDYNGQGRLWHVTDPLAPGVGDDRVTTFDYTGEHLTSVTAPGNRATSYGYITSGPEPQLHALTNVIHPDLTQDIFAYDEQGRLKETSQNCCGGAQRVTYTYDSAGGVTVEDATGRRTQLFYGLGGQLAQVRDGEGRIVNFSYDDASELTQLLGPGGERYRYGYDDNGNLTGLEDPLRQNSGFTYESSFNRLSRVTDARGNPLRYAYDSRGNLTSITYADNTSERFGYNAVGNLTTSTNRRGGVINYRYNVAGQLTNKWYLTPTGRIDSFYSYDAAANLTNASYWNAQLAAQEQISLSYYVDTDRLRRIDYPGSKWFDFEYNPAGRRTKRLDQDGHITGYVYDSAGRLDFMTNGLGQLIVDYDFDEAGRLWRKTLGNGVSTTNAFNAAGQLLQLVSRRADHSLLSRYAYSYDASGRRDSMTVTRGYLLNGTNGPYAADSQSFGYDPLGHLQHVGYGDGGDVNYVYDAAGNRTEVQDHGVSTSYAPNPLNQYTSVGAETLLYDADGNLTNRLSTLNPQFSTSYTYDIENRLISVTTPTNSSTYTYDAFGNRIAATRNGQTTRYVIDPTGLGNVAAEYDGGGSLIARYEHGFGLLARTDAAGDPAFYTFSAIGHTSELTDPAGAVANAYAYDPFGLSFTKTETIPNPFEFVGEFGVMNEGNEVEFMRARFYSGSEGRFLADDPIGLRGGFNLYSYANNRPAWVIDPEGTRAGFFEDINEIRQADNRLIEGDDAETFRKGIDELNEIQLERLPKSSTYEAGKLGTEALLPLMVAPLGELGAALDDLITSLHLLHISENLTFLILLDPGYFKTENDTSSPVLRPHDPNDKLGPSGYGSAGYLPAGGVMAYQIRFENQPSATAPAQRVTVTDTLDPNLDLSTFELTEIAFANQTLALPAGLNHYETRLAFTVTNQTLLPQTGLAAFGSNSIVVDVQAALDVPTRVLTLTLTALDPNTGWYPEDPLTGFLYPNNTNHVGEGSISYLVRPQTNFSSGTVITNRADIVFDYNDPIVTPLVVNTLDLSAPVSSVAPLPTVSGEQIPLHWSGTDDPGGSGVASYDVYVSIDGGSPFLWMSATPETNAVFTGTSGSTYAFHTIARDWVNNVEASPLVSDAQTTVAVDCEYVLSAQSAAFKTPGGTSNVIVTAANDCQWTALNTNSWITILQGSNGIGDGVVSFTVAKNTKKKVRTGTLIVAGSPFLVIQSDTKRPTVTIVSPTAKTKLFTNANVMLQGTAGDNVGLARVEYQLNSGAYHTANGTTNWTAGITFVPGRNTLRVRSIDLAGNVSAVITRVYRYVPPASPAASLAISSRTAIRSAGREFCFGFQVVPGSNYVLQTSTDLQHWNMFSTNRATTSALNFTNTLDVATPQRFFRLQPVR